MDCSGCGRNRSNDDSSLASSSVLLFWDRIRQPDMSTEYSGGGRRRTIWCPFMRDGKRAALVCHIRTLSFGRDTAVKPINAFFSRCPWALSLGVRFPQAGLGKLWRIMPLLREAEDRGAQVFDVRLAHSTPGLSRGDVNRNTSPQLLPVGPNSGEDDLLFDDR